MTSTDGGEVDLGSANRSRAESTSSDLASAAANTGTSPPAQATPFIYPIRSLLSTVEPAQPAGSHNIQTGIDPKVFNDLAASLHREVAARRQAGPLSPGDQPGLAHRSSDRSSLDSMRRPASSSGDKTSERISGNFDRRGERIATATFPSNIHPGNMINAFIPLPTLPKPSRALPSFEIRNAPFSPPEPSTNAVPSNTTLASSGDVTQGAGRVRDFAHERVSREEPGSITPEYLSTQTTPLADVEQEPPPSFGSLTEKPEPERSDSTSFSSLVRLPPAPKEGEVDEYVSSGSRPSSFEKPSASQSLNDEARQEALRLQGPPVTVRLKYTQDKNGHHHVVGREGTINKCEDEPIRTPGAIQSYGVIVVLEEDLDEGRLLVRQVSENIHRVLGLSVPYLFSLECFTDIFPYDQAESLWKHITFLEDPNAPDEEDDEPLPSQSASQGAGATPYNNTQSSSAGPHPEVQPTKRKEIDGPDVFLIHGWNEPDSEDETKARRSWKCWCAAHRPVVPKRTSLPAGSTSSAAEGYSHQVGGQPPTSHSAMKTGSAVDLSSGSSSTDLSVSRSLSGDRIQSKSEETDYQRLIILELELEHDEDNPIYSRMQFGGSQFDVHGSRSSQGQSSSGLGADSGNRSTGSAQPSSGASSGTITTPTAQPPATNPDFSGDSDKLTPLTDAALQALAGTTSLSDNNTVADGLRQRDTPTGPSPAPNPESGTQLPLQVAGHGSYSSPPAPASQTSEMAADQTESGNAWYPSIDDIYESTTTHSKPIKALEKMRLMARGFGSPGPASPRQSPALRRVFNEAGDSDRASSNGSARGSFRGRGGTSNTPSASASNSVGTMDVFAVLAEVIEQLGNAADLDTLLKTLVGVVKDLTQFHRVLVYQFDDVWNGQVVAELVDWSASHDLYKGLHFPAGDIPPQARQLYLINKVRSLYDRDLPTSRLVCRDWSDVDHPLDMTHCYLRAMSPIHIKYLANMGVRASMSISITAFGQLWGLIACHSYGKTGMRVSFPVRQILRLLSDSISRNIERLSYAQRLRTRKLISTIPTQGHPAGYIVSDSDDLLGLFDADYGVLVIGDGAKILGPNDHGRELLIVAQYLRMKQYTALQASQSISQDLPDLVLPSGTEALTGLLYVPLSTGGKDFIVFLRKGQSKDVLWAGRPQKDPTDESSILEPRTSFKAWMQTVVGRCRGWTDEQIETAGVLALVYGKFIEVWRQKESAVKSSQLASLLLENASHEVRTPLNQIIGFLELALEGNLDDETRSNLIQTHKASKSLLFTINDLLDLTKLESGQLTQFNDQFDLPALIREAVAPYEKDALRKNLSFDVITTECPQAVIGDSRKIASVVSNLTANAVKFTEKGGVIVECKPFQEPVGLRDRDSTATTREVAVEIVVADTGCGIPSAKLEDIFRQFEQLERVETEPDRPSGLGLGLAVVARIVEQVGGQLRVDSNERGSRFSFLLPFTLPDHLQKAGPTQAIISSRSGSHASGTSEVEDFVSAMSQSHMTGDVFQRHSPAASSRHQSAEGVFPVQDSNIGIRGVKVDDYTLDPPSQYVGGSHPQPVQAKPSKSTSHSSAQMSYSRPQGTLRILVVEDDRVNSALMVKRIAKWNHIPVAVQNGQEAKDLIETDYDFDCIMMDLQMPIMDGYQATAAIRDFEARTEPRVTLPSHRFNGRVPIFAVSASISEDQRLDLAELGMDGWLLKPIVWTRVQDLINGITNLEQRRKDLYTPDHWEKGGWLQWYEGNGSL